MTERGTHTSKYSIENLNKKHDKNLFCCGASALDQYLKTQASQDIKKNVAVTYVLTQRDSEQILGFYTISSIGIFPGESPLLLSMQKTKLPLIFINISGLYYSLIIIAGYFYH
ncbi:MAG: hypothetical protein A3F18_00695 [Legionellales bacterium RIFCSPHIGHO2_12_FULL_37_14]|nr:MAG: hypothetical protein A3F18_00695 [Legionellales bacterium RIFCSPHIGHO2_12_FULL_37_14]